MGVLLRWLDRFYWLFFLAFTHLAWARPKSQLRGTFLGVSIAS